MSARRRVKGFTLIEVLVAMAVPFLRSRVGSLLVIAGGVAVVFFFFMWRANKA